MNNAVRIGPVPNPSARRQRALQVTALCALLGFAAPLVADTPPRPLAGPGPVAGVAPAGAILGPAPAPAAPIPALVLEDSQLPATGTSRTTLVLDRPGWVTVRARSAVGVAVRLVSAAFGTTPWAGEVGQRDGRLDLALDAGRYRLETRGPEAARGDVAIAASLAVERHDTPVPLADAQTISTALRDGEQRSFVIDVREGESLVIEAAGRALAALRLWRDATWLEPVMPVVSEETVARGRQLRFARLTTRVPPGRYRVVVYGGVALDNAGAPGARAGELDHSPLHIRRGVPELPRVYRADHVASPFGVDRYRIRREPSRFRLELPLPDAASITVTPWQADAVFAATGNTARIAPRQAQADATVSLSGRGALGATWTGEHDLVTVRRDAGQPYTLQAWSPTGRLRLASQGRYRVATIVPGPARDALGANAMLFVGKRGSGPHSLAAADVISLDRFAHWRGRFNLNRQAELFLRVDEAGQYRFTGEGSPVVHGLTPYARPRSGRWTVRRPDGDGLLLLKPGYYRFMLEPDAVGIHTFTITGTQPDEVARPLPIVASFADVALGADQEAIIQLPRTLASDIGLSVRSLPLDLDEPVALTLEPGSEQTLSVKASGPGELRVVAPSDAGEVAMRRVGGVYAPALRLDRGQQRVDLQYRGRNPVQVMLVWTADGQSTTGTARDARLLLADEPQRFHIGRNARVDFVLEVPEAGFYAVETSGLLALSARLDAPARPGLWATRPGGGGGRNARLAGYLDAGHYRLSVTALGGSAGSASVHFGPLSVASGALLHAGQRVAHAMLPGAVLTVPVEVPAAGRYRIAAMGVEHRFEVAVRDEDGWPVVTPRTPGEHTVDLEPGSYTMDVLPGPGQASLVATLEEVPPTVVREGHGPHALPLDTPVEHRWIVPDDPAVRDQWTFSLAAPAVVTVAASEGMTGTLERVGPPAVELARLLPGETAQADLTEGDYRLRLRHGEDASRVDYSVVVRSEALLPGERTVVAVGAETLVAAMPGESVQVVSHGDVDVRAVLFDDDGHEVARSDDDALDWNFNLTSPVGAGPWRLRVLPVGGGNGSGTVVVEARRVPAPTGPDANADADADTDIEDNEPEEVIEERSLPLAAAAPLGLWGTNVPMTVPLVAGSGPGLAWFEHPGAAPELDSDTYSGATWSGRAVVAWAMAPVGLKAQLEPGAPVRGVIRRRDLPSTGLVRRTWGSHAVSVPAGRTRPLFLPGGAKRLVLDLPAGVVASIDGVTLADAHAMRFTMLTTVRRAFLLNSTAHDVVVGLRIREAPVNDGPRHLAFAAPGVLVLPGLPADGAVVGAIDDERFLRPDADLVEPGRLVRHHAGTVAWWDPLTGPEGGDPDAVMPLLSLADDGRAQLTGPARLPAEDGDGPEFLRLVADRPVLVLGGDGPHLLTRAVPRVVFVANDEQWLFAPLEASASLQIDTVPTAALVEGKTGTTQWTGPGETAVWRFDLTDEAVIGLGLRGADDARVTVHDADGSPWGEGVNQRLSLLAGRYWITARNPPDAAPRAVTAVLLGLTPPSATTVPEEVLAGLGQSGVDPNGAHHDEAGHDNGAPQ